MPVSPSLQAEFQAALTEATALKNAADRTEEQTLKLKQLAEETLPRLKNRIQTEASVDQIKLDDYYDLNKPVGTPYNAMVSNAGRLDVGDNGECDDIGPGALKRKKLKRLAEPDYNRAFKAYLYYGEKKMNDWHQAQYKTLTEGIDETSGYFVPPQMLNEIIRRKPAPWSLDGKVRQMTTDSNRVTMLRTTYRDDIHTSPINGSWVGEGGDPAASPEPTYGEFSIDIHEYMGRYSITNTQLEDSGFDLEGEFNNELQTWKSLHFDRYVGFGTGVGQPRGLWNSITDASDGSSKAGLAGFVETGSVGVLDADTLKKMRYRVLPQYQEPGFGWVFNQRTMEKISLLKNTTDGNYLFHRGQVYPGISEGQPDLVDGYPVTLYQMAPDIANNAYVGYFGSAQGYYKPVRLGLTVRRLTEIEALKNRVVFLFRLRWGGRLIQEESLKFIKIKGA